MRLLSLLVRAGAVLTASALPLHAQFDDPWAQFTADPSLISGPTISSSNLETDLAWGDLDQNGLVDLVVARIEPIMGGDPRRNLLFMNEGGVLVDRTLTLAIASDVPGDFGFATPTSDRDVVVVDVDGDGWLDVVTAVGFGLVSDPVHISHPRVYINRGVDGAGAWLGLRYESARIPVLINTVSGLPVAARFNAVAAGDVNGDSFPDLYFGDHDASPTSIFGGEAATLDTDDRLFLNDGNGFFTDVTATSLTAPMVKSNFCNSAVIGDFDGDGRNDVAKQTNSPGKVTVAYNDSVVQGTFTAFQDVYSGSPYNISAGDLNRDGRLDIVVSENSLDGVLYNESTSGGTVNWSSKIPFDFLAGGDDSFAANSLVADLDGDNWPEVLIADVDPQFSGFNRRLHIYHNRGLNPATGHAVLREEREAAGAGWVGAVGFTENDLKGTHDVAVFDVNGDGLDDVVISRNAGTVVWRREPYCQPDLGFGTPGIELEVCGNKLAAGNTAQVKLSGANPGALSLMLLSASANPVFLPEIQATVVAFPPLFLGTFAADGAGELAFPVTAGNAAGSFVLQFLVANGLPTFFSPSNGVELEFLGL